MSLLCGCASSGSGDNIADSSEETKDAEDTEGFANPPSIHSPILSSNYIVEYLKETKDTPIILYRTADSKLTKNSTIEDVYIFMNGKCRKSYNFEIQRNGNDLVLGNLSGMTDKEIIAKLDSLYVRGLNEAIDKWETLKYLDYGSGDTPTYFGLEQEFAKGTAKIYNPDFSEFESFAITDDSGNNVENIVLVLPVAGIDDNPFVMYYPENGSSSSFMNYFNTRSEDVSYRKVKFSTEYFNTGYGTKSDVNTISDLYCVSAENTVMQTIYDSVYYGYQTLTSDWTNASGIIFFRQESSNARELKLDPMTSPYVSYTDPDSDDILIMSRKYYNMHYNSFASKKEVLNAAKTPTVSDDESNDENKVEDKNSIIGTWEFTSLRITFEEGGTGILRTDGYDGYEEYDITWTASDGKLNATIHADGRTEKLFDNVDYSIDGMLRITENGETFSYRRVKN